VTKKNRSGIFSNWRKVLRPDCPRPRTRSLTFLTPLSNNNHTTGIMGAVANIPTNTYSVGWSWKMGY